MSLKFSLGVGTQLHFCPILTVCLSVSVCVLCVCVCVCLYCLKKLPSERKSLPTTL